MSIGLMHAVIKRFVEHGWIMLSNVNLKKLSYAITLGGVAELTARSQKFAKRMFASANKYNDTLCRVVADAKKGGKHVFALYGKSCITFLLVYACQIFNVMFVKKDVNALVQNDAFCVVGELNDEVDIDRLIEQGCTNLLDLLEE